MRFFVFCFLFIMACSAVAYAQHDTSAAKQNDALISDSTQTTADSASIAQAKREQFLADSLAMVWLNPDYSRQSDFLKGLMKTRITNIDSILATHQKQRADLRKGLQRPARDPWIIATIIGLLIYTSLLNLFLNKDVKSVIQSFYDKHALSQFDKEGGLINSWAFIGLFILFSFSLGLVLYQLTVYYGVSNNIEGFQLFISLSIGVSILFALKFFMLKFIGFIFDINAMVSQYIAILNLTYFNIAFILLAVTACLSLLASPLIPYLLVTTVVLIAVIFAWQYVRNSVSIISNFRFHKFYLFIYLCALEICPILILIKALNI